MNTVQVISILGSIFLFVVVVDFVRRNLLKEKYSVLWLALSVVVLVLSLWRGLLDRFAHMVGVSYAPSFLFLVAFIFVILILLHFSVVISILYDKNKRLTQELALLKERVDAQGKPANATAKGARVFGDKPQRRGSGGRGGRGRNVSKRVVSPDKERSESAISGKENPRPSRASSGRGASKGGGHWKKRDRNASRNVAAPGSGTKKEEDE